MLRKSTNCKPARHQGRYILSVLVALFAALQLCLPACAMGIAAEQIALGTPCVLESDVGDLVADAFRTGLGTGIALVPGDLLQDNICAGTLTEDLLQNVLAEDIRVVAVTLTGQDLIDLLEISVSHITQTEAETIDREASAYGGFLQISGFTFRYDASAPVGQRVDQLTLDDGTDLLAEPQLTFTAAIPLTMAMGDYDYPAMEWDPDSVQDGFACLTRWVGDNSPVSSPDDTRIFIRGSVEQTLFGQYLTLWLLFPAMLLIGLVQYKLRIRQREEEF